MRWSEIINEKIYHLDAGGYKLSFHKNPTHTEMLSLLAKLPKGESYRGLLIDNDLYLIKAHLTTHGHFEVMLNDNGYIETDIHSSPNDILIGNEGDYDFAPNADWNMRLKNIYQVKKNGIEILSYEPVSNPAIERLMGPNKITEEVIKVDIGGLRKLLIYKNPSQSDVILLVKKLSSNGSYRGVTVDEDLFISDASRIYHADILEKLLVNHYITPDKDYLINDILIGRESDKYFAIAADWDYSIISQTIKGVSIIVKKKAVFNNPAILRILNP